MTQLREAEAIDAQMCFLRLLKLSYGCTEQFKSISDTLRNTLNEFRKSAQILEQERDRPAVLEPLLRSLKKSCEIGNGVLATCQTFSETLVQLREAVRKVWDSNEIRKEILNKQIDICKNSNKLVGNIAAGLSKFQDTVKEAAAAGYQVTDHYHRMEKELKEKTSKTKKSALKYFGMGLIIAATGGIIFVTVGAGAGAYLAATGVNVGAVMEAAVVSAEVSAGVGTAVSNVAVASSTVGAGVAVVPYVTSTGATLGTMLGAGVAVPFVAGAAVVSASRFIMDINEIRIPDKIKMLLDTLEALRNQLDVAAESIQEVARLSENSMKYVEEIISKTKERVLDMEEKQQLKEKNAQLENETQTLKAELEALKRSSCREE